MKSKKFLSIICRTVHSQGSFIGLLRKRKSIHGDNTGFTLVELLVVVAILTVLVAMAIPGYSHFINSTKSSRSIAEIRTLDKEIIGYMIEKGALPNDLGQLKQVNIRDPWGNQYVYINHSIIGNVPYKDILANNLNSDYDLYSMGQNGTSTGDLNDSDSLDDIVRTAEGSVVCLGKNY